MSTSRVQQLLPSCMASVLPTKAPAAKPSFPFLALPAEIRIQIYQLDMPSQRSQELLFPGGLPGHLAALWGVTELRADMLPHLFRDCTVVWMPPVDNGPGVSGPPSTPEHYTVIPHIRHLVIRIDALHRPHHPAVSGLGTQRSTSLTTRHLALTLEARCGPPNTAATAYHFANNNGAATFALLRWMSTQSRRASGPSTTWNLTTLTLVTSLYAGDMHRARCFPWFTHFNPHGGGGGGGGDDDDVQAAATALARDWPVIHGLRALRIRLDEQAHTALFAPLLQKLAGVGVAGSVCLPFVDRLRGRQQQGLLEARVPVLVGWVQVLRWDGVQKRVVGVVGGVFGALDPYPAVLVERWRVVMRGWTRPWEMGEYNRGIHRVVVDVWTLSQWAYLAALLFGMRAMVVPGMSCLRRLVTSTAPSVPNSLASLLAIWGYLG